MLLHWSDHLFFIVVGILIPLRTVLGTQPKLEDIRFTTQMKLQLYWGNSLWLWILCLATAGVWWFNDRSWELIGLVPSLEWPTGWPLMVVVGFSLLYVVDTVSEILNQQQKDVKAEELISEIGFLPQSAYEYGHFIFLALTAGICEEFIFRGYFIRYFQCLLGGEITYTFAILLPALIFGFVHFYQGWQAVIKITAMAIMFGYIFVHTGSLWLLMIVHALVDLLGGFIAWQLLQRRS
jgi:membrane protease YdiL (CAAX protease family)